MKPSPVTEVSALPMILTMTEVAALYRISTWTIRRLVQNGTFSPRPHYDYPYRWRREDVLADLNRPRVERPHKPHGFATTRRRRPLKATLDSQKRSAS